MLPLGLGPDVQQQSSYINRPPRVARKAGRSEVSGAWKGSKPWSGSSSWNGSRAWKDGQRGGERFREGGRLERGQQSGKRREERWELFKTRCLPLLSFAVVILGFVGMVIGVSMRYG